MEALKFKSGLNSTCDYLYVGKSEFFFKQVQSLGVGTCLHIENPMKAYRFLKASKRKLAFIFCDADFGGMDLMAYLIEIRIHCKELILIGNRVKNLPPWNQLKEIGVTDFYSVPIETEALQASLNYFDQKSKLKPTRRPVLHFPAFRFSITKRLFDLFFSLLALVLLSPILILVAFAIKIDSKGPVFFISKRIGSNYRVFSFYKFRTMKSGAENRLDELKSLNQYQHEAEQLEDHCRACETLGKPCSPLLSYDGNQICENLYLRQMACSKNSFVKFKNDPRVTKLGEFLRKTSIDELPQLLNILKGDMSFVGNRPLPIYEAEQLTTDLWAQRFMAPAGLTGLWQVKKRGKAEMSELERKNLDNQYALKHSFWGDLALMLKTIPALIQKENV